jgi:hypothetical protein
MESMTTKEQRVTPPIKERAAAVRASYLLLPHLRGKHESVTLTGDDLELVKDLLVYVIRDDQYRVLHCGERVGEE